MSCAYFFQTALYTSAPSECDSEHSLQGAVRPIPVAERVTRGGRELPEKLRAGQVDRVIRGIQPASLRKQIVRIHTDRQLILLPVSPRFGNRVLRPPHPSRARDPVTRVPL